MIGINHTRMNDNNKYIILKALATKGSMSRMELSKMSKLSKMTITAIVNEYIEQGIIQECGESNSSGGRRAKLLEIPRESLLTLGIYIGREHLQVGIISARGENIVSESIPFKDMETNDILIHNIFYLCDIMMKNPLKDNIWSIGVSCAGPLSLEDGRILNPPNFNQIHDLNIVDILKERYSLPCYLQNDMCVAALAESYYGNKKNFTNFFYLGVSYGIGGGVIINRKLYTGAHGLAGIIGHCIVEPGGIMCQCGKIGCLEKYSSIGAVLDFAREQSGDNTLTWLKLVDGLNKGNDVSIRALNRMADYLYIAINNFQMAYDMQGIIIGGKLYGAKKYIVERVRERMHSTDIKWKYCHEVNVQSSSFVGNASFNGIAALALENNIIV